MEDTLRQSMGSRTLAVVMALGACGAAPAAAQDAAIRIPSVVRLRNGDVQNRNVRARQTDQATHTLDIGADGSLELRNVSGDVTVTAARGLTATVEVTRVSQGRTSADARRGLEEVQVDVTGRRGRGAVVTRYPEDRRRPPYSVSTSYTVTAPVGTRLSINTISGDVSVTGIHGDLSLDLISGTVHVRDAGRISLIKVVTGDITVSGASSAGGVTVSGLNGTVTLERITADQLSVSAITGDIRASDIAVGGADLKTMAGSLSYRGPLDAQGRYEFQAHSGTIDLSVAGAVGFELEARTFSGTIRPDAALRLQNLTSSRRTVRGRVGSGGAVVVATTFSGDVVIRRR
jgi:hypothetical protein